MDPRQASAHATAPDDSHEPEAVPQYRPLERFWPYADLPEHPADAELASLDPDLQAALFGTAPRPFSITLVFPPFEGPAYERALAMARASTEYCEVGSGAALQHRARFYPTEALQLRDLFDIVGRSDRCEVLIDDRPVPYARELWLPLIWFLIRR
ncbi:MAG: hypothetical protein HYX76_03710 [Acidobacteria bacterium]|nr:hypothetical protein [Acidobacteriota bacterium]